MRTRRLIVTLPSDAYRVLTAMAQRDERAVDQQASVLLKRALAEQPEATASAPCVHPEVRR